MRPFGKYPPSPRFKIGPLQIDLERGTVSGLDGAGGLTSRAEHLLLLLARYPNLLVTRDQILETIWAGRVVEDAAITNCIWQIRKAIGERGKEILLTRAKRGYLLVVADDDWMIETTSAADSIPDSEAESDVEVESQPQAEAEAEAEAHSATTVSVAAPLADPPATAVSDGPSSPAPSRRRWASRLAVVVALAALVCGVMVWRAVNNRPDRILLQPDVDLTVSIEVPDQLDWLRGSILRSAVDQAYLRRTSIVLLQKPQRRNPFAGAHLEVLVVPTNTERIKAEISLSRGELRFENTFVGPATELHTAIETLLNRALAPQKRPSTQAGDALMSGMVADMQFDHLGAVAEYRRALGLQPDFVDAKIAMASTLLDLGNSMEALAILKRTKPAADWTDHQRCAYALLAAALLPAPTSQTACDLADIYSNLNPTGARLAQRRLEAISGRPMGASRWFRVQAMSVEAQQYLGAHPEAEFRSRHAERVAADAGWDQARWRLAAERCKSVLYTGRNDEGIALCEASANALEAMGDVRSSLPPRTLAIQTQRREPGPATSSQRVLYRAIVDQARSIGSPRGEVDALLAMIALDRDNAAVWRADMARVQQLIDAYYAPAMQTGAVNDLTTEYIAQRQYRAVLKRLADLASAGSVQGRTTLYQKAQSYFALDELTAAVAQIDEMDKRGFDVADTNPCLFAWLYVEVDKPDRARTLLKQCPYETWDSKSKAALRGDWGLLANALLYRLDGEPERAWPTVQSRIDELLATRDPGRLQAEALAFLARHAVAMPGADLDRLQRALAMTAPMAEKDGAGPNLRFGVHVLRWRLCAATGPVDGCGPVLPSWALDDHLERRLAIEAAGR
jgi:DNA-binding winged helix-turn-helix (wHTH) protein